VKNKCESDSSIDELQQTQAYEGKAILRLRSSSLVLSLSRRRSQKRIYAYSGKKIYTISKRKDGLASDQLSAYKFWRWKIKDFPKYMTNGLSHQWTAKWTVIVQVQAVE